jgi:hypothetical protein
VEGIVSRRSVFFGPVCRTPPVDKAGWIFIEGGLYVEETPIIVTSVVLIMGTLMYYLRDESQQNSWKFQGLCIISNLQQYNYVTIFVTLEENE